MLAWTGKIVHFLNAAMRAKLVEYRAARARLARLFQSLAAFVGQCPSCSVSDVSAVLAAVESKAERGWASW